MIHLDRDKQTTLFYFKTDVGKLPQALSGFWTNKVQAERALELYQGEVQGRAERNSAQVRKAKGRTLKKDQVYTDGMIEPVEPENKEEIDGSEDKADSSD